MLKKHGADNSYSDTVFRTFKGYYDSLKNHDAQNPIKSTRREQQRLNCAKKLITILQNDVNIIENILTNTTDGDSQK